MSKWVEVQLAAYITVVVEVCDDEKEPDKKAIEVARTEVSLFPLDNIESVYAQILDDEDSVNISKSAADEVFEIDDIDAEDGEEANKE